MRFNRVSIASAIDQLLSCKEDEDEGILPFIDRLLKLCKKAGITEEPQKTVYLMRGVDEHKRHDLVIRDIQTVDEAREAMYSVEKMAMHETGEPPRSETSGMRESQSMEKSVREPLTGSGVYSSRSHGSLSPTTVAPTVGTQLHHQGPIGPPSPHLLSL